MFTRLLLWGILGSAWAAPAAWAQATPAALRAVDARSEVARALYDASATHAAELRSADDEIRRLKRAVHTAEKRGAAALAAAQERYVAALAGKDREYATEIAVFRQAVEDIASTPEGLAALARFNAGDEVGALAVLDDLRAARDRAREKAAAVASAAEGRRIATLALEAMDRGKVGRAAVAARFEEVTRLDPGVHWDWVELGRLSERWGGCQTRCVRQSRRRPPPGTTATGPAR